MYFHCKSYNIPFESILAALPGLTSLLFLNVAHWQVLKLFWCPGLQSIFLFVCTWMHASLEEDLSNAYPCLRKAASIIKMADLKHGLC